MILAGDLGGTKTILALFHRGHPLEALHLATYASRAQEFPDLLDDFLARAPAPLAAACFGIAGPVIGERVQTTNLPWVIDGARLRERLGVPVFLLNDLESLAHGLALLPADRLAVVNAGASDAAGNAALIAAGTGLGEAGLVWDGSRHVPFATEGGHADFAARSPRELELLRYLLRRYEHVSYDRVLSGLGLALIFEFLRDVEGYDIPPPLDQALTAADPAPIISSAGLAGRPPIAVATLDLFTAVYGAEAGNLALKLKATGGVYLGGGIAPKLLPKLQDGTFMKAFLAKGRFAKLLAGVPVRVVLDQSAALYGCASYAEQHLADAA
jgi:glucokinase